MKFRTVFILCFATSIVTQTHSESLKTFEAGERVKAAEVNSNFEYLDKKIDAAIGDEPPTIEVLNFGYDATQARYTGDLVISDDNELIMVNIPIGSLKAPDEFYQGLSNQDLVEFYSGYFLAEEYDPEDFSYATKEIKAFWPAPSSKFVNISNARFNSFDATKTGPFQVYVQDNTGKVTRLVIEVPAWPGGKYSSGKYVLDTPFTWDSNALASACNVNAIIGSPLNGDDIVSYQLTESIGHSAPINYVLVDNNGRGGSFEGSVDETEILFMVGGGYGSSSSDGNWYADSKVTLRFISDSVVSIELDFECGFCADSCAVENNNRVPEFTYSTGETTAVLTVDD